MVDLSLSGAKPNSGTVLPQKLIIGFPDAAATCIIIESLVRISPACWINCIDSDSGLPGKVDYMHSIISKRCFNLLGILTIRMVSN